jgi:hypothetical protein
MEASDAPFDLTGVGLSDDSSQPFKWRFPAYTMAPRQYLVVFASDKNRLSPPLYYETILRRGDTCKYLIPNASTPSVWRSVGFNDSSWPAGTSGFGYGDGDDSTLLPNGTLSVFIRKTFYISDPAKVKDCWLHMDYDDGFVAYLNGKEIARAHLGTPGVPPPWNATADAASHEAVIYQGGMPQGFHVPSDSLLILPGKNVLAIQVHNTGTGSSDMTAIPFLTLGFSESAQQTRGIDSLTGLLNSSFHTNFTLSSAGDTVLLTSAGGSQLDVFEAGPLKEIFLPEATLTDNQLWLFARSTPGMPNTSRAFPQSAIRTISFSHPGGIFSDPFQLQINGIEAGDTVYYTLDGREPVTSDSVYTHPITIDGNTVVRARLFNANLLPGKVQTISLIRSYIAGTSHGFHRYRFTYNLFDYYYGIYEMGPHASPDFPYFGANFWQEWERPVHIDLIEPDTSRRFSTTAGIKIYGNYSRGNPQKSFAFYARGEYGAKEFAYPLFPNLPFTSYQAFVLRNSGKTTGTSANARWAHDFPGAETGIELQAYARLLFLSTVNTGEY